MRRLILLRHAKTERDAPSGRDFDRRLDERGVQDANALGPWLARHGYLPELVLVSPAVRAQETWSILSASMPQARRENVESLYSVDAGELLRIVHGEEINDPKIMMVVAHNPTLHELALGLIASGDPSGRQALAANLPTSGVVVIDLAIDNWGDAGFRKGTLERFISPKLLKEWSGEE